VSDTPVDHLVTVAHHPALAHHPVERGVQRARPETDTPAR
jgi:hypothetical protein